MRKNLKKFSLRSKVSFGSASFPSWAIEKLVKLEENVPCFLVMPVEPFVEGGQNVFNDRGLDMAGMLVIEVEPVIVIEEDGLDFDDAGEVFHC